MRLRGPSRMDQRLDHVDQLCGPRTILVRNTHIWRLYDNRSRLHRWLDRLVWPADFIGGGGSSHRRVVEEPERSQCYQEVRLSDV